MIRERDAYGRRRSSRSIKTGPGSRGGTFHIPEARRAYFRRWRAEHPEYRDRERQRTLLRRAYSRLTNAEAP